MNKSTKTYKNSLATSWSDWSFLLQLSKAPQKHRKLQLISQKQVNNVQNLGSKIQQMTTMMNKSKAVKVTNDK